MMFALYLEAPFAVCRTFTAGWYRPTATFLTPSAAYGLVMNLAGIETRLREEEAGHAGNVPSTLTRAGLPALRLALGIPATPRSEHQPIESEELGCFPRTATIYQQLHNYPVGTSGGTRAPTTFGNKYNITPVRREILVGLRAIIAVDATPELEASVRLGIAGESSDDRYGLPFLGDNSFLLDRVEILDALPPARWYERISAKDSSINDRTTRLTILIDRANFSRTESDLYAPSEIVQGIPEQAWTKISPHP